MPQSRSAANLPGTRAGPRLLWQVALLVVLWWFLTSGVRESWLVGVPSILAAVMLSRLLAPREGWQFSLMGLLTFIPHFLRLSLLGALDVAWRSLHPGLPIEPRMIEYELRLRTPAAQISFMSVVSLLPGTVTVDVRDRTALIHVIDRRLPVVRQLQELERLIGRVFRDEVGGSVESSGSASGSQR